MDINLKDVINQSTCNSGFNFQELLNTSNNQWIQKEIKVPIWKLTYLKDSQEVTKYIISDEEDWDYIEHKFQTEFVDCELTDMIFLGTLLFEI